MSRERATRSLPLLRLIATSSATPPWPRISTDRLLRVAFVQTAIWTFSSPARSLTGDDRAAILRQLLPISGAAAIGRHGRSIELTVLARPTTRVLRPAQVRRASIRRTESPCSQGSATWQSLSPSRGAPASPCARPVGLSGRRARGLDRSGATAAATRRPGHHADSGFAPRRDLAD